MKIVDPQTTVVGTPWRELTFLELETDSGLVGPGEVAMVNKTDTLLACIRELAPPWRSAGSCTWGCRTATWRNC